jgi:putative ABC transport system permease protein
MKKMTQLPVMVRQVRRSAKQALLFVLCTALSLTALTAFSGFSHSVERSLLNDARKLHAADIIVSSYDPISAPVDQLVGKWVAHAQVKRADIHHFLSMVRAADESAAELAGVKVVGQGYPFYGQVKLASGRPFHSVLVPGTCIVGQTFLARTGLRIGSRLHVGYATLTIADVVLSEPDQPLNFFSFGPRVFVHHKDLAALGLIAKGGRIRRKVLLKVKDPTRVDVLARQLKQVAAKDQERVETFRTAGTRTQRFLDNFFFFLKLVGLFILLLAGLGIQGTVSALLKEKQPTIAIMKAVGATNGYLLRHFTGLIGLLGGAGTLLGILSGMAGQRLLAWVMAPYLPAGLDPAFSWGGVAEAVALGCVVVLVFSFLPLYRVREMRPMLIFRKEIASETTGTPFYIAVALVLIFFFALVVRHMHDVRFGLYFVGGICALVAAVALLTQGLLFVVRRRAYADLKIRQAVKGLFRKGNATPTTIITLTVSLSVIFANYFIEKNLDAAFVQSFPQDAPNAYFVDIQPDQTAAFLKAIERPAELYPIVRARVTAIDGTPIDKTAERKKHRDNFSRVFNLTYRQHLLADERIVQGDRLFRSEWTGPQVSILDTVAEMRPMHIGDTLRFKIQGVPLEARISSIRSRRRSSFSPFFYFVFPDKVLEKAPHTYFAALKIPPEQLGVLQRNIVSRFPNISVIDLSQAVRDFARLMGRLSRIIRGFGVFSIGAGLLILVSAIYATRAERMVEAVYYKILGAGKAFVFKVFALENLLIGAFSGILALMMAQAGAYWVCTARLDVDYHWQVVPSLLMAVATMVLVVAVGLAASWSIMEKRPITYLREQTDE